MKYYTKGGKVHPITPPKRIGYSGLSPQKDHSPKYRIIGRKKPVGFTRQEREMLANKRWAKKILDSIPKEKREIFDHAVILLKPAIPFIVSLEPTIATIWGTYRFGKFGYDFATKVNHEARSTGSYEQALLQVTQREFNQKIISKFESLSIKKASEYTGRELWTQFKNHNPDMKISEKLDKHAENALIHTFKEIGNAVV